MSTDELIALDKELIAVLARRKAAECAKEDYLLQGAESSESQIIHMPLSVRTPLGLFEIFEDDETTSMSRIKLDGTFLDSFHRDDRLMDQMDEFTFELTSAIGFARTRGDLIWAIRTVIKNHEELLRQAAVYAVQEE